MKEEFSRDNGNGNQNNIPYNMNQFVNQNTNYMNSSFPRHQILNQNFPNNNIRMNIGNMPPQIGMRPPMMNPQFMNNLQNFPRPTNFNGNQNINSNI